MTYIFNCLCLNLVSNSVPATTSSRKASIIIGCQYLSSTNLFLPNSYEFMNDSSVIDHFENS